MRLKLILVLLLLLATAIWVLFTKQEITRKFVQPGKLLSMKSQYEPTQMANESHETTRQETTEQLGIDRYIAVNNSVVGKPFELDYKTAQLVQTFLRNLTFKRKPITIDPNSKLFDVAVPVTGSSSNHYGEFKGTIGHFAKRFAGIKVVFFDLGLTDSQAVEVKKLPFMVYRKFDFSKYPTHVKTLTFYAWKILLIQEMLAEVDGVLWFDTSIVFDKGGDGLMAWFARVHSGFAFYLKYSKGHSMAAATHPGMLEYFPVPSKDNLRSDMGTGGGILIFNTADIQQHVMKWATLCALLQKCIAPPGSQLSCPLDTIWSMPRHQYANCHRYDQALFSLIVSNLYRNNTERYKIKLAHRV